MKIRLENEPPWIGILVTHESENTKPGFVSVLKFILAPAFAKNKNSALDPQDMSYFSKEFLQVLFDAMWKYGIRPSIEEK